MRHITTDKGDIGVAKVTADLLQKGASIYSPVSATCPFDILIETEGIFKRVQVKYRNKTKNNTLTVDLKRNTISNGKVVSTVRNEFVDILAIYCPETDKCYYAKVSDFDKCIALRLERSKNNQSKGVRMADDYLSLTDS